MLDDDSEFDSDAQVSVKEFGITINQPAVSRSMIINEHPDLNDKDDSSEPNIKSSSTSSNESSYTSSKVSVNKSFLTNSINPEFLNITKEPNETSRRRSNVVIMHDTEITPEVPAKTKKNKRHSKLEN